MSEAVQALAFVARRTGTRTMSPSRWALVMSLELGWMSPGEARAYVAAAMEAGVLSLEGDDAATLVVDPDAVPLPLGFRPDPSLLPKPMAAPVEPEPGPGAGQGSEETDPFALWLRRVRESRGVEAAEVLAAVAVVQERFGGRLEALPALWVVAREAGLDVSGVASDALEALMSGSARSVPP